MTIIYLIRHGMTDALGTKLCGRLPGIHLNDEGRIQAGRAARFLEGSPITAVYSSPMERTMETAAVIAYGLNLGVKPADFLSEINFGSLHGLSRPELIMDSTWQQFMNNPSGVQFPNGESVVEAQTRIVQGLNRLVRSHKENEQIVCVSHCELLRLAVAHALDIPLDSTKKITLDPAGVSKLDWLTDRQKVYFVNTLPG